MRYRPFHFGIIVMVICSACSKQKRAGDWTPFISKEYHFYALFPNVPKEEVINFDLKVLRSFSSQSDDGTGYFVSVGEIPKQQMEKGDRELLDSARNAVLAKGIFERLLQERAITNNAMIGRDLEFVSTNVDFFANARFFISGNRFYQLGVITPKGKRVSTNASYFLDSFRLMN